MSTPKSFRNTINNDQITMLSGSTVSENSGDLDLSDEALLVIEVDSIGIAASSCKGSHSVTRKTSTTQVLLPPMHRAKARRSWLLSTCIGT